MVEKWPKSGFWQKLDFDLRLRFGAGMFLVRARMGMRPGDSLVSESTRQMVQTVLAERRLAEAMAKLSPEAQTAVRKMGTQLANMTKDETFNNAAEHLVSTAHSTQSGGHRQGHEEGGLVVLLPSLGCVSRSGCHTDADVRRFCA